MPAHYSLYLLCSQEGKENFSLLFPLFSATTSLIPTLIPTLASLKTN